jgi:predicted DNA-binding helix-hairpin-helix protein
MPVDNSASETKVQRLELMALYVLCAALLAGLGFLWAAQQGWFRLGPVVMHSAADRQDKPIEINTASWSDLTQIRGVGEARAKEIIFRRDEKIREQKSHKEKTLGFGDFDEFMKSLEKMPGLTKDIQDQLRQMVRVEPIKK